MKNTPVTARRTEQCAPSVERMNSALTDSLFGVLVTIGQETKDFVLERHLKRRAGRSEPLALQSHKGATRGTYPLSGLDLCRLVCSEATSFTAPFVPRERVLGRSLMKGRLEVVDDIDKESPILAVTSRTLLRTCL